MGYITYFMNDRNYIPKKKLRELLRKIRKKAGVSQVNLARQLGRPQSFVSKFESGEKTLDFFELKEVCEALGISMLEFVKKLEKLQK